MDKEISKEDSLEQERRKFWKDVWIAVATASNSFHKEAATGWADDALKKFDERFNHK